MEVNEFVADDEVINKEIEDPIKDEVTTSASSIAEELFRHERTERRIEKINTFGYFLTYIFSNFAHIGCKITAFLPNMQVFLRNYLVNSKKSSTFAAQNRFTQTR